MRYIVEVPCPVELFDSGDKVGQYPVATIRPIWLYHCARKLNAFGVVLEIKLLRIEAQAQFCQLRADFRHCAQQHLFVFMDAIEIIYIPTVILDAQFLDVPIQRVQKEIGKELGKQISDGYTFTLSVGEK